MNKKQRATLAQVFERPTRADVRWADVESLLHALGATVKERKGSRVAIDLKSLRGYVHTPHPGNVMKKYAVEYIRCFLTDAGVQPEQEE